MWTMISDKYLNGQPHGCFSKVYINACDGEAEDVFCVMFEDQSLECIYNFFTTSEEETLQEVTEIAREYYYRDPGEIRPIPLDDYRKLPEVLVVERVAVDIILQKDPKNIWLLDNKKAAEAFAENRLEPSNLRGFYNAMYGTPCRPETRTINVLVHGAIQEWTAYSAYNKDPETLTVKNHHDYASDVSLVFNVKTKELVDFRKNRFLSEAKWVD